MGEIIRNRATGHRRPFRLPYIARRKAIGVVTKILGVDTFELDAEIGGTAIIKRVEPIWFPAGS